VSGGTERGQATVELAVTLPVCIVVALVLVNALVYATYCTKFDLEAARCAVSLGTSPDGAQTIASAVADVQAALEKTMGSNVAVSVSAERLSDAGSSTFSLVPGHVRFTCTMTFVPYPLNLSIAGVRWSAAELKHERRVVVDMGPGAWGRS
jgi:hypothetical protein